MTTSYKMRTMPAANCHIEINRDGKHNMFKGVYLYSYRTLRQGRRVHHERQLGRK